MAKIPCRYFFGGKTYTKPAFQAMLADGGLQKLADENIIDIKPYKDAIPEQSTTEVSVRKTSTDRPEVGQRDEGKGPVDKEVTGEKEISSIEDLEQELSATLKKVKRKVREKKGKEPPAKLADQSQRVALSELGINKDDSAIAVIDKLISVNPSYAPFLKVVKKRPFVKKMQFIVYEPNKFPVIENYLKRYNISADQLAGLYFRDDPKKHFRNVLFINDIENTNYNLIHELGHALTLENIDSWKRLITASDKKLLEDIFNYIKKSKGKVSIRPFHQYGLANIEEFLVEAIINPAFRQYVSDVVVKDRKEFLQTVTQNKPRRFIDVIRDLIGNMIRYAFGYRPYAEKITDKPLIDQAVDILTKIYLKGDPSVIEATKDIPIDQQIESYPNILPDGPLAMPARRKIESQEDAVKDIIRRAGKNITNDKLLDVIEKATGLDPAIIQQWIDEIRIPPAPPAPPQSLGELSPESRGLALKKFDNLFKAPETDKPNWITRFFGGLKNASAWIDNPYRFVTKITEDVRKEYNVPNKEVIPLGRAFEKNAAGRAALKVEKFVSEVLNGKIGDKNLGRLKGEKFDDFQKYMAARRVIDRHFTQERKRQEGDEVNRQTGNITKQDADVLLDELRKKYGDEIGNDFALRAEAFQENMDEMLQMMTGAGLLSKEAYDNIKEDNDFYAPFSVVQTRLLADQDKAPVGISGVVKRIKGIGYQLPKTQSEALAFINDLGKALTEKVISPEEYFNTALATLNQLHQDGVISEKLRDKYIEQLANPGFALNGLIDAAANMIYKAEGLALKNIMMTRLYAYKQYDKEGLYIQDVDGFQVTTLPNGEVRRVPKPLNTIPVEEGMAPVKLRVAGKDVIVAINKYAAKKINDYSNFEVAGILKAMDWINKLFRTFVITVSTGFQISNFLIDFVRTAMLSRYGLIGGKGYVQPVANAVLFIPQYLEAFVHTTLANVGVKTPVYKQWMNSDSFSKGMFDNLFDNEKRIKSITASGAKKILDGLWRLKFIEAPGAILEQTHKLLTYQRGAAIEGLQPKMFTAMMSAMVNRQINENMTEAQLKDAADRLNYEVQNFAGSPNFPQTHRWLKLASMFMQFFSARVKGELTDYRRLLNIVLGRGEGVKFNKAETMQMALQFSSIAAAIAAYAIMNNMDDEDEEEFDSIPSYHQDNYLNIPAGLFEYTDEEGVSTTRRDYIKIPLRGLTSTMNVVANRFVKWYKRRDPAEFKKMAENFLGNASPVNLQGADEREMGESFVSNLTPVMKFFLEYSFNRDTHAHRDLIPDGYGPASMLQGYKSGKIMPWDVKTKKTPEWAIDFSKYLYETLGIRVAAITLDHMENTLGNPSELYQSSLKKRLQRSEMKYPVAGEKPEAGKPKSSLEVTPVYE